MMILCACAGWFGRAYFAHVRRHCFSWRGPNTLCMDIFLDGIPGQNKVNLFALRVLEYGPRQAEKCLQTCAKCAGSHHPAHAQIVTWSYTLLSYILKNPITLLTDSESPDQTARMRSLIWAFAVRISPKTRFRMAQSNYDTENLI